MYINRREISAEIIALGRHGCSPSESICTKVSIAIVGPPIVITDPNEIILESSLVLSKLPSNVFIHYMHPGTEKGARPL